MEPITSAQGKIAGFLRAAHPSSAGAEEAILRSADLFADGWVDSLLHLRLLGFLEKEFDVRVAPYEVTRKSFLTVAAIAELVRRHRHGP